MQAPPEASNSQGRGGTGSAPRFPPVPVTHPAASAPPPPYPYYAHTAFGGNASLANHSQLVPLINSQVPYAIDPQLASPMFSYGAQPTGMSYYPPNSALQPGVGSVAGIPRFQAPSATATNFPSFAAQGFQNRSPYSAPPPPVTQPGLPPSSPPSSPSSSRPSSPLNLLQYLLPYQNPPQQPVDPIGLYRPTLQEPTSLPVHYRPTQGYRNDSNGYLVPPQPSSGMPQNPTQQSTRPAGPNGHLQGYSIDSSGHLVSHYPLSGAVYTQTTAVPPPGAAATSSTSQTFQPAPHAVSKPPDLEKAAAKEKRRLDFAKQHRYFPFKCKTCNLCFHSMKASNQHVSNTDGCDFIVEESTPFLEELWKRQEALEESAEAFDAARLRSEGPAQSAASSSIMPQNRTQQSSRPAGPIGPYQGFSLVSNGHLVNHQPSSGVVYTTTVLPPPGAAATTSNSQTSPPTPQSNTSNAEGSSNPGPSSRVEDMDLDSPSPPRLVIDEDAPASPPSPSPPSPTISTLPSASSEGKTFGSKKRKNKNPVKIPESQQSSEGRGNGEGGSVPLLRMDSWMLEANAAPPPLSSPREGPRTSFGQVSGQPNVSRPNGNVVAPDQNRMSSASHHSQGPRNQKGKKASPLNALQHVVNRYKPPK